MPIFDSRKEREAVLGCGELFVGFDECSRRNTPALVGIAALTRSWACRVDGAWYLLPVLLLLLLVPMCNRSDSRCLSAHAAVFVLSTRRPSFFDGVLCVLVRARFTRVPKKGTYSTGT